MNWIKEQFLDIIEYIDESDKILVHKYNDRPSNEIKKGAKSIIREGQCGVFVKGGKIADVWNPRNVYIKYRKPSDIIINRSITIFI